MERDGRYFARVVIPKDLRPFLDGKTELRAALGGDRSVAIRKHPAALAGLMETIASAERQCAQAKGKPVVAGRYPLTDAQIARQFYDLRLALDEEARNTTQGYGLVGIDDGFVAALRRGLAGQATDDVLDKLVGSVIDHYRRIGNTTATRGTQEWRSLARALCQASLEAIEREFERDEGDFAGTPKAPLLKDQPAADPEDAPVSLMGLFEDYVRSRQKLGGGKEIGTRWLPAFNSLVSHLKHDNARKVTKQNVIAWRDTLSLKLAASTISKVHLTALKTVFEWAVREDRLTHNPAKDVRQDLAKQSRAREKGFTLSEATAILHLAAGYVPTPYNGGPSRELPQTSAAKRWVPFLMAYSGARVAELTQLRKEDVRKEGDIPYMRITPDAGSVKTNDYRDVPIHPALIAAGFVAFVAACPDGPLFYSAIGRGDPVKRAQTVGNRIAEWLKNAKLVPADVAPNHGWRHRFKTVALEEGQSGRIVDAICGHAGRTAGDTYGDVTVKAKYKVISAMPEYNLGESVRSSVYE
jgi:integrase